MFNVQGKNVVIVGGLNGVGLSLTKALLNKRVNQLTIIDVTENVTLIQELRTQYQTKINFERIDYLNFKAGEIQNVIQNIVMKMQYIDVFINAFEMVFEKDLQRTMDFNMTLYMNMMMFVRNVMNRNKGGRGGIIVNVLSNLGLKTLGLEKNEFETSFDVQQYFINKQMLLSLTKAFSDEIYFQQTGVRVMSVMPVINQKMIVRNIEWIKKIGLQNLVGDMSMIREQNSLYGHGQTGRHEYNSHMGNQTWDSDFDFLGNNNMFHDQELSMVHEQNSLYGHGQTGRHGHNSHMRNQTWDSDFDFLGNNSMFKDQEHYNTNERMTYDQDLLNFGTEDIYNQEYLKNDWIYGQRLGGVTGNIRKLLDILSYKILRVIELGQNGATAIVGLGGLKNIQQTGSMSRF